VLVLVLVLPVFDSRRRWRRQQLSPSASALVHRSQLCGA
jgi:hypothetical protein